MSGERLENPRILFDTNAVLYFLGGRFADPLKEADYFISVITEIELLSYPSLSSNEEQRLRAFIRDIQVVGLEDDIKEEAIKFRRSFGLKLPDAVIAASAKILRAILLTNDGTLSKLNEIHTASVRLLEQGTQKQ